LQELVAVGTATNVISLAGFRHSYLPLPSRNDFSASDSARILPCPINSPYVISLVVINIIQVNVVRNRDIYGIAVGSGQIQLDDAISEINIKLTWDLLLLSRRGETI